MILDVNGGEPDLPADAGPDPVAGRPARSASSTTASGRSERCSAVRSAPRSASRRRCGSACSARSSPACSSSSSRRSRGCARPRPRPSDGDERPPDRPDPRAARGGDDLDERRADDLGRAALVRADDDGLRDPDERRDRVRGDRHRARRLLGRPGAEPARRPPDDAALRRLPRAADARDSRSATGPASCRSG